MQYFRTLAFTTLFLAGIALPSAAQTNAPQAPLAGPASFADLAEKLLPSVVNISTTQTIDPSKANKDDMDNGGLGGDNGSGGGSGGDDESENQQMPDMPQFPPGSPFEQFFKDFLERHGGHSQSMTPRKMTSLGSGFIIDPSGYVVTNNHVIEDADEINVILHDNTTLKAKLIGRDTKTDLALLKVETKKPLTAVAFGDSDKMRVGDWILAIGNPFGLGGTVTAGIISARARDINAGPYDDFLQTDAPINRGNSGGPMFNMNGDVIGINTAIFSPSGGSVGIGFAIPSAIAKQVIDQLKDYGKIKRGWIGVRIQQVTDDIAQGLGLSKTYGALIASVNEDGPAAAAGIKAGDVITTFNGKEVSEMRKLPLIVAETPIGQKVPITIWRDGKEVDLTIKIGEMPATDEDDASKKADKKTGKIDHGSKIDELGLTVAELTPDLRQKYNLTDAAKGVVITIVDPLGPAADKGLSEGDLIREAGGHDVTKIGDLTARVETAKKDDKPILLLVEHNGDTEFVAVPLKKKK